MASFGLIGAVAPTSTLASGHQPDEATIPPSRWLDSVLCNAKVLSKATTPRLHTGPQAAHPPSRWRNCWTMPTTDARHRNGPPSRSLGFHRKSSRSKFLERWMGSRIDIMWWCVRGTVNLYVACSFLQYLIFLSVQWISNYLHLQFTSYIIDVLK